MKTGRSRDAEPRTVAASDIQALQVRRAGEVDLRRDLHRFLEYVQDRGLRRTKRANLIPKVAARRLAKILSFAGELEAVEQDGSACWSDRVSHIARDLGLVSFDTEGEYEGYSSTETSYPENDVSIETKAWRRYLQRSPLEKERALLGTLVEHTPNEFFEQATLIPSATFDRYGCKRGPAGKMDLPRIRRQILDLLSTLEPGTWYAFEDVVDLLGARHPELILDPANREPTAESAEQLRGWEQAQRTGQRRGARGSKHPRTTKPEVVFADLYTNFREADPAKSIWSQDGQRQLTAQTPQVFHRVVGRYLEFFLREIPFFLGFVDLGYRPDTDPHGLDVSPPFERLVAIRLTDRFASIMSASPTFGEVKVTIFPTFEILVESDSYPETTLQGLAPFTQHLGEDGPIHKLKLDRVSVTRAVAEDEQARPAEYLAGLSGRPLPQNILFELEAWASRGDRLVIYEDFGLLEMRADEQAAVLEAAGDLVLDTPLKGFALVREPSRVFDRLEARHLVPLTIRHRERGFATCTGRLASVPDAAPEESRTKKSRPVSGVPTKARMATEDLVGCRSASAALLKALFETLSRGSGTCVLAADDLLVVSASRLPALRRALRGLDGRFDITLEDSS